MDPVDRTFDTVYYWSQRAKRAAGSVADTVASSSSAMADSIAAVVIPHAKDSPPVPRSSGSGSWSLAGLAGIAHDHQLATGATVLALLGLSAAYAWNSSLPAINSSRSKQKRRAHRLLNGARKDVVLVVGSVIEPLTRYIAHDLEARGFIVYITSTDSKADHKYFQNESMTDVKSLVVSPNPEDSEFNSQQLHKFDYLLSSDHIPFQGAEPNKLNLVGIIFVPDIYFPAGKFHLIPSATWTRTINERALLPLNLLMNGVIGMAEKYDANMIFLTPTISSSIGLPYHSLENVTTQLLQTLSLNLSDDYESLNITNLRLGAVNVNSNNNRKNFGIKGEPIRHLHHKIFDLIYSDDNDSVAYVGVGARSLSLFGNWIPRWVVRNYFNNYFARE